jgi:steroid 5-alpha reductase family enzyme
MGLRRFHLFFIAISVLMAAFVVAWATDQYRAEHQAIDLVWASTGLVLGAALAVYGTAFQRKTKNL